jgi:hypothetical protein
MRTLYECVCEEDHIFQSFQVFSIADWISEFVNNKKIAKRKFFKSGV